MHLYAKLNSWLHITCITVILVVSGFLSTARSEGLMVTLVPVDGEKMAIAPPEDIPDWNSNYNLVDTSWAFTSGAPGGIGFDNSGDYNEFISLNIASQMQGQQNTCYVRAKFNLTAAVKNELDYLALGIRYDDGFIAYLNGERVTFANAPINPGWRSAASQPHEAQSMIWFDISEHVDKLKTGNNLFAIHGMNVDRSSPDFLIQAELVARKNYQDNFVSDLPIFKIKSDDNLPVNANTVRDGSMNIINNGTGTDHRLVDAANDYSGRMSITENSTIYDYPKNHYFITLKDDLGQSTSASLLGLPEGDEWILYAPYNDKTLLRTVLMGELAHQLGRAAPPKLCHVFLNDDYKGLYVLLEKNNRHANRINIPEPGEEGDALTGGYILELNKNRTAPGFDSMIEPFRNAPRDIRYVYNFPDASALSSTQENYIQNFINGFEADVVNSIDIASAVDYFLLNEIAKNIDAYRDFTVLYKDRDSINPKMFIHSTLDFNNACGNTRTYDGHLVQGWQFEYLRQPSNVSADSMFVPLWWQQLYDDVTFTRALYKRWDAVQDNVLSEDFIIGTLDSLYTLLDRDGELNFERWPVAGKPILPNGMVGETFDEDFDYLYLWMIDRLDWMREAMEDFATSVESATKNPKVYALEQNYPNPFNPSTTISYQVPATGHVAINIYNIRGERVAELVDTMQASGRYDVSWDATGWPSGVYFYELRAGEFSQLRRMLLIR